MPIRTGEAYLASLRDGRQIWIDGALIPDVTTDRRLAGAAQGEEGAEAEAGAEKLAAGGGHGE